MMNVLPISSSLMPVYFRLNGLGGSCDIYVVTSRRYCQTPGIFGLDFHLCFALISGGVTETVTTLIVLSDVQHGEVSDMFDIIQPPEIRLHIFLPDTPTEPDLVACLPPGTDKVGRYHDRGD